MNIAKAKLIKKLVIERDNILFDLDLCSTGSKVADIQIGTPVLDRGVIVESFKSNTIKIEHLQGLLKARKQEIEKEIRDI